MRTDEQQTIPTCDCVDTHEVITTTKMGVSAQAILFGQWRGGHVVAVLRLCCAPTQQSTIVSRLLHGGRAYGDWILLCDCFSSRYRRDKSIGGFCSLTTAAFLEPVGSHEPHPCNNKPTWHCFIQLNCAIVSSVSFWRRQRMIQHRRKCHGSTKTSIFRWLIVVFGNSKP